MAYLGSSGHDMNQQWWERDAKNSMSFKQIWTNMIKPQDFTDFQCCFHSITADFRPLLLTPRAPGGRLTVVHRLIGGFPTAQFFLRSQFFKSLWHSTHFREVPGWSPLMIFYDILCMAELFGAETVLVSRTFHRFHRGPVSGHVESIGSPWNMAPPVRTLKHRPDGIDDQGEAPRKWPNDQLANCWLVVWNICYFPIYMGIIIPID